MRKRLLFVCFALAVSHASAQFTDPHTYDNTPVGTNQIELAYAFARSDSSLDTSLIVSGAKLDVNQGSIQYARYFGFLHRLAWVQPGIPIAGLNGSISGINISGSTVGTGDSSYMLAMLLKGGPALSMAQFENYNPTTVIGASLTVTAPTGFYNSSKLLNLGSDRWSFKPEIALSQPFGPEQKWQLDVYANTYFYTDNTSYRGVEILRQQPLAGLEGHISYSFTNSVWAAVDTRYSFRGETLVNGVDQNNSQQNFILGSEVNVSLNARNSLVFEWARALAHQNGPAISGFAVKYDYSWGRGYR
ncbi:transporter [Alloacidobacterium sp.]|uniref:transporter n=1 Tax=Alloacidobacterium sp. TaxID=2951999 RepID=UPI002D568E7E|nr:transporter [Alloacidobacterium sp.]HYK35400.1 transporter [Alloacidobacterium sp.]